MVRYVDEIIVSFYVTDKCHCECNLDDIRYCPSCKICRNHQYFKSRNKNIDYNKLCRRCLDSMNKYKITYVRT